MNRIEQAMEPKPGDPNAKVPDRVDRLVEWVARVIRAQVQRR